MTVYQRVWKFGRTVIDVYVGTLTVAGQGYLDGGQPRHPETHWKAFVIVTIVLVPKELDTVLQLFNRTGLHHCINSKLLVTAGATNLAGHVFNDLNQFKSIAERFTGCGCQFGGQ